MTKLAPEQDPKVWSMVAEGYAAHVDPMTSTFAPDVIRLLAPKEGERVLDVACGAGAVAIPAAGSGAEVLATDITPAFVEIVRERADEAGLTNVDAQVMDGQALDLADDTFDAAMSNFGVFLFPQRAKGFAEMHRVLRPGGRAVVTSFMGPPDNEWIAFFGESVRRAFPDQQAPPPPQFLELADPNRLQSEMSAAGFSEVEVETVRRQVRWPSVDAMWMALAESAPIFRPLMDKVGPEGKDRLRAVFEAMAEERFGDAAPAMETPVHVALAHKA